MKPERLRQIEMETMMVTSARQGRRRVRIALEELIFEVKRLWADRKLIDEFIADHQSEWMVWNEWKKHSVINDEDNKR